MSRYGLHFLQFALCHRLHVFLTLAGILIIFRQTFPADLASLSCGVGASDLCEVNPLLNSWSSNILHSSRIPLRLHLLDSLSPCRVLLLLFCT